MQAIFQSLWHKHCEVITFDSRLTPSYNELQNDFQKMHAETLEAFRKINSQKK